MSRFIPNFSQKTADLRELLKKDAKFIWTDRQSKAYEILKSELTSDSVLAYYDPVKPCILVTDACNTSIGAILLQKHPDGERPVEYVGRSLTDAEKKYNTTECESLALVWAIEKLHLYLYQNHFTARVDHRPLEYIFGPKAKWGNPPKNHEIFKFRKISFLPNLSIENSYFELIFPKKLQEIH